MVVWDKQPGGRFRPSGTDPVFGGWKGSLTPSATRSHKRASGDRDQFPFPKDIEALVIHHEDSTGLVAVRSSQGADQDGVRDAVNGVRGCVIRARSHCLRLNHLQDFRSRGSGFVSMRFVSARSGSLVPLNTAFPHAGAERVDTSRRCMRSSRDDVARLRSSACPLVRPGCRNRMMQNRRK